MLTNPSKTASAKTRFCARKYAHCTNHRPTQPITAVIIGLDDARSVYSVRVAHSLSLVRCFRARFPQNCRDRDPKLIFGPKSRTTDHRPSQPTIKRMSCQSGPRRRVFEAEAEDPPTPVPPCL